MSTSTTLHSATRPSMFLRRMALGIGERLRGVPLAVSLVVAGAMALILALVSPPRAQHGVETSWQLCAPSLSCTAVDVGALRLDEPITKLTTFYVRPLGEVDAPLAVSFAGMASAEVYWNGVLIGRNGIPGPTRATEISGRFTANVFVPAALIHDDVNQVDVYLSAHHLWAPVLRPMHRLSIGRYQPISVRTLIHYVPTFVLTGLLLAAVIVNATLWRAHRHRAFAILTGLSFTVLLQSLVETCKGIVAYTYPWQVSRLFAIALLAALVALLLVASAASFIDGRRMRVWALSISVLAVLIAVFTLPWWDAKTLWAYRVGVLGALIFAAAGTAHAKPSAVGMALICIVGLGLSGLPDFLDSVYYLLVLLAVGWQTAATTRDMVPVQTAQRAEAPNRPSDEVIFVPDGGVRHRILASQILYVRAADDYCTVHLKDGREILSTFNLSAFLKLVATGLIRIHRSHAVNAAEIVRVDHSGRYAHTVLVGDGQRLSVGRTYWQRMLGILPAKSPSI